MFLHLLLLPVFLCPSTILTADFPGQKDEVKGLPGLTFRPNFRHYSGYLNGSSTVRLHYWMVESQKSPSTDPLVLWLNGGPGCSSLDGLLTEHGPFRVNKGGRLTRNPYSWNKIANMIYLESPACVGYSYSTSKNCSASDILTASLNTKALLHFLVKFPQYKGRTFYITGESYGGYYVPTLAVSVLKSNLPVKFKGIAVGNGLSSLSLNENGNLHFAYNHGLISDSLWNEIIVACCKNKDPLHCEMTKSTSSTCTKKIKTAVNLFGNINVYNIYSKCVTGNNQLTTTFSTYDMFRLITGWNDGNNKLITFFRNSLVNLNLMPRDFGEVIPCIDTSYSRNYMNNPLVRSALHIPSFLPKWTVCNGYVNINYVKNYENMTDQYNTLFKNRNIAIWIYNGDVDMACSYLSDEWFFERFNRRVVSPRRPWLYKDETNQSEVGGYVKQWDRFVLLTIRGSGHMVPTDRPIPAYKMFQNFLLNKPL